MTEISLAVKSSYHMHSFKIFSYKCMKNSDIILFLYMCSILKKLHIVVNIWYVNILCLVYIFAVYILVLFKVKIEILRK